MIKEAIERLIEIGTANAGVQVVEGVSVSAVPLQAVAPKVPEPPPIVVHTLGGFVEYYKAKLDDLVEIYAHAIHVVDQANVRLILELQGPANQRFVLAHAKAEEILGASYRFGTFIDAETFVIALQALFVDGFDRANVLALAGNITEEGVKQTGDDGVTQTVIAKKGVALKAERTLPNPVRLQPFRTFPEIEQPDSPFVLRAQDGPKLALFECDGGAWKLEAIKRIRTYLRDALGSDVVIVA